MPEDVINIFIKTLVEIIYEGYIETKLAGLPTSLTTVVRSKAFYDIGSESYKTLIRAHNISENNFIHSNRALV